MAVFISHDFNDENHFHNIVDALKQAGIEYFDPEKMGGGNLLADMLRDAIRESEVCVFIATVNSLKSSWCNAELGAFWGVGKKVIIYWTDTELKAEEVPRQFAGHLRQGRIKNVVEAVKEAITEAESSAGNSTVATADEILKASSSVHVGDMTRSELRILIESAIRRSQTDALAASVVGELVEQTDDQDFECLSEEESQQLRASMSQLLGLSDTVLRKTILGSWPHQFFLATPTGEWTGYARERETGPSQDGSIYLQCLLLRFDQRQRLTAAAILPRVADVTGLDRRWKLAEPVAMVGRGQIDALPRVVYKEEEPRYIRREDGVEDELDAELELADCEDREAAIERLRRLLTKYPDDFRSYGRLTQYYLEADEPERAHDLLLSIKDRFPKTAAYFHFLGLTLNQLEDLKGAVDAKRRAVELEPEEYSRRLALAFGLWRLGLLPATIDECEQALLLAEKHCATGEQLAKVQNSLAYYLAERGATGDCARARDLIERALGFERRASWLHTRGFVLLQCGRVVADLDVAIDSLSKALEMKFNPAVGTDHLRMAFERRNQLEA